MANFTFLLESYRLRILTVTHRELASHWKILSWMLAWFNLPFNSITLAASLKINYRGIKKGSDYVGDNVRNIGLRRYNLDHSGSNEDCDYKLFKSVSRNIWWWSGCELWKEPGMRANFLTKVILGLHLP